MARVKGGPKARRRHNKILKIAKGHYGRRNNTIRAGVQSAERALQYSYRDRRQKKRNFRSLWIMRINAAARLSGLRYSELMNGLKKAGITLDRKVLADIAVHHPEDFAAIAKQAAAALKKAA